MKLHEINLRDPFILLDNGTYYLYGTRGSANFGESYAFYVHTSDDLENWSEGKIIFEKQDGFWGEKQFWAPEVHAYKGKYYMFATFKSDSACRGTQILVCDTPDGTFKVHSPVPITPKDWECLDGTFYVSPDGTPYMVFCHEWLQVKDGEMCCVQLSEDLTHAVGEPKLLFKASSLPQAAKNADHYVTDGPFLHRTKNGRLLMIWSSFADNKYIEAVTYSDNGDITGSWLHCTKPLFFEDGGHGMLFTDKNEKLRFILHRPNTPLLERPVLFSVSETKDGFLTIQ